MSKMYAFKMADGSVAIHRDHTERLPIAEQIAKYEAGTKDAAGNPASVVSHVEITDVPADRTFRNAWDATGSNVDVDMPKARVIHMDRIRGRRNEILVESDADLVRAMEGNDTAEENRIKAKRQALRDLPANTNLNNAPNPTALDAIWPNELGTRPPKR